MRELAIRGAVCTTTRRSTITDPAAERPADLVERQFRALGTEPAVGGRPALPADLVGVDL